MRIDFSDVLIITTTTGKAVSKFMATVMTILSNVKNAQWVVNTENLPGQEILLMQNVADMTNNRIDFIPDTTYGSVAFRKAELMQMHNERRWVLNVDDDFIIPYNTLHLIKLATQGESKFYTLNQVDVDNVRGYKDWDRIRRSQSELPIFATRYGSDKINCHLWEEKNTLQLYYTHASSGAYLVHKRLIDEEVVAGLQSFKKGERLYDVWLAEKLNYGYSIVGATVYHLITESYFNEKWSSEKQWEKKQD